jgi:hypothetical protein
MKRHHTHGKVKGKDGMMHADHHMYNGEHDLPQDVFGHDGESYSTHSHEAPCDPDNEVECD